MNFFFLESRAMSIIKKIVEFDLNSSYVDGAYGPNGEDLGHDPEYDKFIDIIIENSSNEILLKLVDKIRKFIKNISYRTGYCIITDDNLHFIMISNEQLCCEEYGIIKSNDDLSYYEGLNLIDIKAIEDDHSGSGCRETCTLFVNIETSKGLLQLNVYNTHNGYYGHNVEVKTMDNIIYKTEL
jgi:hypothetical protein